MRFHSLTTQETYKSLPLLISVDDSGSAEKGEPLAVLRKPLPDDVSKRGMFDEETFELHPISKAIIILRFEYGEELSKLIKALQEKSVVASIKERASRYFPEEVYLRLFKSFVTILDMHGDSTGTRQTILKNIDLVEFSKKPSSIKELMYRLSTVLNKCDGEHAPTFNTPRSTYVTRSTQTSCLRRGTSMLYGDLLLKGILGSTWYPTESHVEIEVLGKAYCVPFDDVRATFTKITDTSKFTMHLSSDHSAERKAMALLREVETVATYVFNAKYSENIEENAAYWLALVPFQVLSHYKLNDLIDRDLTSG